ncbi:TPA: hypothetical protein RUZ19_003345 [Vibrio cholerae]|uniref:hypothetical protein n=1 Tax=Vibrio cholerae TaxID=666 RepID=UPI001B815193|nr:hypothetical protein [Vibrio cholerae]HDZ9256210.1 hypothetical protein [Vibrio cholerae]
MKWHLLGVSGALFSSLSISASENIHSVNFDLSFFGVTKTCEITTSQVDEISDPKLLSQTPSGIKYFSKILSPTVAWKSGETYTTNCIAKLPNTLINSEFVACYSRETSIRKFDKSMSLNAEFIDEFCYSEPSKDGYYFEYRIETDNKQIAIDASERGRCRYTCIVK